MKKNSTGSKLPGCCGIQVADGLMLGKKNLPTGVENISLGEECLTLVKTAPVALFITSLEKPGLAARAQLKLMSPFP